MLKRALEGRSPSALVRVAASCPEALAAPVSGSSYRKEDAAGLTAAGDRGCENSPAAVAVPDTEKGAEQDARSAENADARGGEQR